MMGWWRCDEPTRLEKQLQSPESIQSTSTKQIISISCTMYSVLGVPLNACQRVHVSRQRSPLEQMPLVRTNPAMPLV
jgi:hypothetical protein